MKKTVWGNLKSTWPVKVNPLPLHTSDAALAIFFFFFFFFFLPTRLQNYGMNLTKLTLKNHMTLTLKLVTFQWLTLV